MEERAVAFGPASGLVGVLCPAEPCKRRGSRATGERPAFILLDSGAVHRIGHHRLQVRLARRLSARGFSSLRFDFSGLGDSAPEADGRPFEDIVVPEIRAAVDLLAEQLSVRSFVPFGICAGARHALRAIRADNRAAGAVLVNGRRIYFGDRGPTTSEALAVGALHHGRLATSRSFAAQIFRRVARGRVSLRRVFQTVTNVASGNAGVTGMGPGGLPMIDELLGRGLSLLVAHSEADEGLDHLTVSLRGRLSALERREGLAFELLRGANHTFLSLASQEALVEAVVCWAARRWPVMGDAA